MKIISKEEFIENKGKYIKLILKGAIFIYPTDTIYGIGCNAKDSKAVRKIRKLKKRPNNPFSVIAPSKKWIQDNCIVGKEAKRWTNRLPGPYTLILKQKKGSDVSRYVNPGSNLIGVRIPKNWFSSIISKAGIPFVTTSVNEAGKDFMKSEKDINPDIRKGVDLMIYEGKKAGRPSALIDLSGNKASIKKR